MQHLEAGFIRHCQSFQQANQPKSKIESQEAGGPRAQEAIA